MAELRVAQREQPTVGHLVVHSAHPSAVQRVDQLATLKAGRWAHLMGPKMAAMTEYHWAALSVEKMAAQWADQRAHPSAVPTAFARVDQTVRWWAHLKGRRRAARSDQRMVDQSAELRAELTDSQWAHPSAGQTAPSTAHQ